VHVHQKEFFGIVYPGFINPTSQQGLGPSWTFAMLYTIYSFGMMPQSYWPPMAQEA
jgi:hypothetical protein